MRISEVAKIVIDKIDSNKLTLHTYVSTENLNPNFGGINIAANIPLGNVTQVKPKDILVSNIRPYFKKIWFSNFMGGCSNDVICLRVFNSKIMPKFLFYLLNTDKFIDTYVSSSKGTKMPRGDKKVLLDYKFELPNLKMQQHIVDIGGNLWKL